MLPPKILRILLRILIVIHLCANIVSGTKAYEAFLAKLFESYEKGVRPNYGGDGVTVGVTIYVLAVSDIDEKDMTITTSMYVRETWKDPRLSFQIPANNPGKIGPRIQLQGDQIRNIWVPDTFVPNEVTSFQHKAFVLNEMVRISSDGTVLKSGRFTVTSSCPMDLHFYPFDIQTCLVEIESYGSTMAEIQYKWDKGSSSVGVANQVTPTHTVVGHRMKESALAMSTGNYSRIAVEFIVRRYTGRFILRFYMPMILFVLVSLLSLWIASEKMATLINFLNICFINLFMGQGSSGMPVVSYSTQLDVYFLICIFHVGFCLLDSLIATYFAIPERIQQPMEMSPRQHEPLSDDVENLVSFNHPRPSNDFKRRVGQIFFVANLFIKSGLFVSFVLCNLIYSIVNSANEPHLSEEYVAI